MNIDKTVNLQRVTSTDKAGIKQKEAQQPEAAQEVDDEELDLLLDSKLIVCVYYRLN